jgi:hypothetical protein
MTRCRLCLASAASLRSGEAVECREDFSAGQRTRVTVGIQLSTGSVHNFSWLVILHGALFLESWSGHGQRQHTSSQRKHSNTHLHRGNFTEATYFFTEETCHFHVFRQLMQMYVTWPTVWFHGSLHEVMKKPKVRGLGHRNGHTLLHEPHFDLLSWM